MSTPPPDSQSPAAFDGTDHDALPPGTRFGEFEILRTLGVGGFGIVYLAIDHSLEREVALKEYMPASLAARGQGPLITVRSKSFAETYAIGLRSFVNEARLLARFDHPSLVKVYRFWEDNATAYMVMPFLQGVTLRDTRRSMAHPPNEAWIRSVMSPILSALELLHREGVYHRDIAPDNILLPPGAAPVLLDFGAARRVISDRTQSLTAILKPSYAPIEQYAEMTQMRQGPWTDLYALGAVVHYLLFGVPPSPATARAVQDESDSIEQRIVPNVSPRFLEAVAWMLAIRPNQRPQSVEQLRSVLDGKAEVPRGRAGTTIPGAPVPPIPAAPPLTVERAADATRVQPTAQVPTHVPTASMPTPADRPAAAANFSPTTRMPTARVPPPSDAAGPAAASSLAREGPSAPAPTLPPLARATPPVGASVPPRAAPSAAALAARPAEAVARAERDVPTEPMRAVPPARFGAKGWLAVAGIAALIVVVAVLAWQLVNTRRDRAAEAAAAAGSAASATAANMAGGTNAPASATAANATTPAASAAQSAVVVAMPPAPVLPVPSSPAAAVVAAPAASHAPIDADAARPSAARASANASTNAVAVPPAAAASLERRAAVERTLPAIVPGASAAASARVRPPGRPVPRIGDNDAAAALGGTPSRGQDASAISHPVPPPVAADTGPATAREACGKRVFIALAVCMDSRCEEARYRNTEECVAILARKRERENSPFR